MPLSLFDPDQPARQSTEPTVAEIIDLYLRHSKATGLHGPQALKEREGTFALFRERFGEMFISECKPFHLSDWIESYTSWRSVSTRRTKANAVRAAFQWAVRGERIQRNPFFSVRYGEAPRRPELPDVDLDALCKASNKHFERAAKFLRLTGCRLSELCEARWPDMDLHKGIWTIPKHKSFHHTKKPKEVALVADAVKLLLELGELSRSEFVFVNTRGKPWNRGTLGQHLRRMKAKHGISTKATLHGVRHRAASAAIAAGASIKLVAAQLGHSTVAVTERYYVHLEGQIDAIREAFEKGIPHETHP